MLLKLGAQKCLKTLFKKVTNPVILHLPKCTHTSTYTQLEIHCHGTSQLSEAHPGTSKEAKINTSDL